MQYAFIQFKHSQVSQESRAISPWPRQYYLFFLHASPPLWCGERNKATCPWGYHGLGCMPMGMPWPWQRTCMAALTLVAYPHMSKGGYLGMPWPWQLAWWAAKNMPYCPHSIQTFPGITRTKSNFPFTKTILIVLPSKLGEKIVEWFLLFYFSDNNRLMVQPGLPDYY